MEKVVRWALILASMALVFWIRMIPLSLPLTEDWADGIVRQEIRDRLEQKALQPSPPSQRMAQVDVQVTQWIDWNRKQFEAEKAAVSQYLGSRLRYKGKDGQEYVYLGGRDGYLWLRNARNFLRTGTTCDAIVDGDCRDTYGNAPVGSRMIYNRSLHIASIIGLHQFITLFKPDYPLPASSFWVPVILSVLGVLPAFFIGQRLAGNIGGLFAAILIALHSSFLIRSIGSDNDVWNVVLPLFTIWASMAAMGATNLRRQVAYGVLAGAFTGLHAATWRGWIFTYAIVVSGLLGYWLLYSVRYAIRKRTLRIWQAQEVRRAALLGWVFYIAAGLFTTLADSEEPYFQIPLKVMRTLGLVSQHGLGDTAGERYWPHVLTTVSELYRVNLEAIVHSVGGTPFFLGGLLGLLLALLPKTNWNWRHFALLLCGASLYLYTLTGTNLSGLTTVGLLALPMAVALPGHLSNVEHRDEKSRGAALVVVIWFLAALYMAFRGIRFFILMAPPFGVAFAVAAGRLFDWLSGLAQRTIPRYRDAAHTLFFVLLALILIQPIQRGYATARDYIPKMNDAWWGALVKIRDESRPDAIVNTWWDFGYWVKYVAERKVSADGSSLKTHVSHWLGKALIAPSRRESLGVLRMLNCGSDTTPLPEGRHGAYGKILTTGRDALTAYSIVTDLVNLEREEAQAYLEKHGFTGSEQAGILRSTHCRPPETYFIISSEQVRSAKWWMRLGLWDPRRAYIAKKARSLAQAEGVADFVERLGYTHQEAERLYLQARALMSRRQRDSFVAPREGFLSDKWLPCRTAGDSGIMLCPADLWIDSERKLDEVLFDPASPMDSRLRFHYPEGERLPDHLSEGTPAVIVLVGAKHTEEIVFPSPKNRDLGLLVDIPNDRILVGSPPLIRSTFTHLMFLDGRLAKHYEKFDERMTYSGDRIVTWKINWDE